MLVNAKEMLNIANVATQKVDVYFPLCVVTISVWKC